MFAPVLGNAPNWTHLWQVD